MTLARGYVPFSHYDPNEITKGAVKIVDHVLERSLEVTQW